MGVFDYIKSGIEEYKKKGITKENVGFYSNVESFVKTGVLQVIYCLSCSKLRMSELQYFTELSNSVLVPLLNQLIEQELIEKYQKEVTTPRKGKVSFYSLTNKGKKLAKIMLVEPEGDIETYGGVWIKKDLRKLMNELVRK